MEVSLAIARGCGPSRLAYNESVRAAAATFNRILTIIHVAGPGAPSYPPVRCRPPVTNLVQSILAAPLAMKHPDEQARLVWMRKFDKHASDDAWHSFADPM